MTHRKQVGFFILIVLGFIFLAMLFLGQMMSFIDYEFTVSIGLQESVDVIGEMGVAVNRGFGVGDTIIYIPLLVTGLVGLLIRKKWGLFAMAAALGITAYWPVVSLFILLFARGTPGFHFTDFTAYTVLLTAFTLYGLWGLGYVYRNRKKLAEY